MVKVYEVDPQYIHQNIAKGKTIMKFVQAIDYRELEMKDKETEKKIKEIIIFLKKQEKYWQNELTKMFGENIDLAIKIVDNEKVIKLIKSKFPEYFKENDK